MVKCTAIATVAAVVLGCAGDVPADVVIELVPVGNAGNPADVRYPTQGVSSFGAVDYNYKIGKYEVTAEQYAAFLNAVAADDTFGLYNSYMWSRSDGCKIQQSGISGSYTYSVAPGWEDRPVNYVSWYDTVRFANWLHNGQPTGAQAPSTTEDGAYDLSLGAAVVRKPGALVFLPNEDEWYKAAYHKNDGVTGNYFDYPTSSDAVPSNDLVEPNDPGNNATFYIDYDDYTVGGPFWRTEVGEHENSPSPYGTFDQGGNAWEWNETVIGPARGVRGGSFYYHDINLHAATRHSYQPAGEAFPQGFRVAAFPEPGDCHFDGGLDLQDWVLFEACLEGPSVPMAAGCECADATDDGTVDLFDFARFQEAFRDQTR